jgi:hypothetical protein
LKNETLSFVPIHQNFPADGMDYRHDHNLYDHRLSANIQFSGFSHDTEGTYHFGQLFYLAAKTNP